jgi:hypothetical protein
VLGSYGPAMYQCIHWYKPGAYTTLFQGGQQLHKLQVGLAPSGRCEMAEPPRPEPGRLDLGGHGPENRATAVLG